MSSDPAADASLESPPAAVTLIFSEQVTPAGAGIRVFSPSGHEVAAPATSRGSVLVASVQSGERGTFVVSWQVFTTDTHPSRGAFQFIVGTASPNPYSALLSTPQVGTSTPVGIALQALAHWVHFFGLALVIGVAGYRILIGNRGAFPFLVGAGVAMLITAEPLALLSQLASLSFDSDTVLDVLGSNFGRLLGLRLGAALLMWTLTATGSSWTLIGIGGVIALLDGAGAHAIPSLPGVGQPLVAIHVMAMGLWAGGLVAFVAKPDARFVRYAAITLGVAVTTGLLLALAHTHLGASLLTSGYGRVVIVKVAVVSAAALLAFLQQRRLELSAVVAVIAVAAVVAALPPPF